MRGGCIKLQVIDFFLAMKLNFFLMFFVVLSASANIDVMSQRVNLDFKNTDLSTVFKSLESQTGHIFVYSADRVQADQIQVSIQLKDTELKQALEVLFKDLPYKYSVEGQSVLIIPVPRQIPRENTSPFFHFPPLCGMIFR